MRHVAAVALALTLVTVACGDSSSDTTSSPAPTSTEAPPSTDAPAASTSAGASGDVAETAPTATTTTAVAATGDSMDCADMWPEDVVQSVLGDEFSLGGTTGDGAGCSFEALPAAMVLSWRPGGQAEFDAAGEGASLTSDVEDVSVCNGGWAVDLGGVSILEALGDGRIFNATSSSIDQSVAKAAELVASAC